MNNTYKTNSKLAVIFREIADLLDIKGVKFKPAAYRKAAKILDAFESDIEELYAKEGKRGLKKIAGIGESIAQKIEEYLKRGKIAYQEEIQKETAIRQIITHYFETKGLSLERLKQDAAKKKIVYSRFVGPAKQLLKLAGSVEKAKEAISKVAEWANSRGLEYAIETVFKKWLELDRLKPKEIVKKPFYDNHPMVWSDTRQKWYVIGRGGEWLEFAGDENDIEWKVVR